MKEMTRQFYRTASYRGSDVRLATGVLQSPDLWPRRTVDPSWWKWRVVLAYRCCGSHINVLEMRAAVAALRWRCRSRGQLRVRFGHLLDSQVCISVITKGRSSSQQLRFELRRFNALMLASSNQGAYVYVRTDLNPADAPSRWVAVV